MNKKLFIALLLLVCMVLLFSRLKTQSPAQKNSKITITTSFYPLYFFAKNIGGDNINVVNITPSGSEPHDYEPTAREVATMEESKLLVLQGGKLEPWGDKIKVSLAQKGVTVVVAGDGLTTQRVTDADGKTGADPHTWLDPVLAKKETETIANAIIQSDPANATVYTTNAKNLESELDQLDTEYRNGLAHCQKQDLITSHAAFGYLAKEYGLNQISIAGLSPDAEPSSKEMANVAKFAKARQVDYIFFESLVSPKLSQTIANEIGAKTLVLNPIEGLSDQELTQGKNYFTVMRENLTNLETALVCQP